MYKDCDFKGCNYVATNKCEECQIPLCLGHIFKYKIFYDYKNRRVNYERCNQCSHRNRPRTKEEREIKLEKIKLERENKVKLRRENLKKLDEDIGKSKVLEKSIVLIKKKWLSIGDGYRIILAIFLIIFSMILLKLILG